LNGRAISDGDGNRSPSGTGAECRLIERLTWEKTKN
jgi:hypothetical protein